MIGFASPRLGPGVFGIASFRQTALFGPLFRVFPRKASHQASKNLNDFLDGIDEWSLPVDTSGKRLEFNTLSKKFDKRLSTVGEYKAAAVELDIKQKKDERAEKRKANCQVDSLAAHLAKGGASKGVCRAVANVLSLLHKKDHEDKTMVFSAPYTKFELDWNSESKRDDVFTQPRCLSGCEPTRTHYHQSIAKMCAANKDDITNKVKAKIVKMEAGQATHGNFSFKLAEPFAFNPDDQTDEPFDVAGKLENWKTPMPCECVAECLRGLFAPWRWELRQGIGVFEFACEVVPDLRALVMIMRCGSYMVHRSVHPVMGTGQMMTCVQGTVVALMIRDSVPLDNVETWVCDTSGCDFGPQSVSDFLARLRT